MKKTALLTAAAALMMATPAMAQGYVGASYQNSDLSGLDIDNWSVNGAAALGSNFQVNALYTNVEDADVWGIGGHLFSRGTNWLWGGFVGYTSFEGDFDEWTIAGETQFYMDRTTLTGTLGYTGADLLGTEFDQWALDGEVRAFVSDNFSLQGNLGWMTVDTSGGSGDGWTGGVGAEFQFTGAPISIHGGYQHSDYDGPEIDSFNIGARWNFGGQTLFERNRSGAGLNRPAGFLERFLAGEYTGR